MDMEIKLLAVDMDETVVNSRHQMTEQTKLALELAIQKGILVVPVTGRCLEGLPAKIRRMDGVEYFITSNGAKAYDFKEQRILYRRLIPNQTACAILKKCQEEEIGIAIHQEGKCYDNSFLQVAYRYVAYHRDFKAHRVQKDLYEWVRENEKPVEKIQVFSKDEKKLLVLQEMLERFVTLEMAVSTSGYIEITQAEANKGKALEALCDSLGISLLQVMAIGDNANDFSMLERVGFPVAMGNAKEELKQIAKTVTTSNDEDGVAKAIYEYLL